MNKKLNKEEKEFLESYEKGEWEKIPNYEKENQKLMELPEIH